MCTFLYSCKYKEYKNKQLSSYIDSTLQVKATSILENKLSELNALSGQIIIMEVQTGYIKTMVGLERKDSTDYQPCENFSQAHESALMHPISILAALETGKVKLSDMVDVGNGSYIVEFCGYFPTNVPQYSIIVSIHKERLPASSGLMAGDVFRQITEYISTYNKYFNSK